MHLMSLIQSLYEHNNENIKIDYDESHVESGVKLLNIYSERVMREALEGWED